MTAVADSAWILEGIQRTLPGLEQFLRVHLVREALSTDAREQLEQLLESYEALERQAEDPGSEATNVGQDASEDGHGGATEDELYLYRGFLGQAAAKQMGNYLSWNRRWCVLRADDAVLRCYRSNVETKPISEIPLRGCRVGVCDPRECADKPCTLKIVPPDGATSKSPSLLRTYEESEFQKCLRALATATGVHHSEEDLTKPLPLTTNPRQSLSAVNLTATGRRVGSPQQHRSGIGHDGRPLTDRSRTPSVEDLISTMYDVPRRTSTPAEGATEASAVAVHPTEGVDDEDDSTIEPNYAEIHVRTGPERSTERGRDEPGPEPPILPPRQISPLISVSPPGAHYLSPPSSKPVQQSQAAANGDGIYESLAGQEEGEQSEESDSEGIYEPLDRKGDTEDGYTSQTSISSSIMDRLGFRRGRERASGQRRHRLSKSAADLDDPDQDGFLMKRGASGRAWNRRWCVLKDYCLYYFNSKDDKLAKDTIILPGWHLATVAEEVRRPNAFKLSHEGMEDCVFAADNTSDFETWMASLERCLRLPEHDTVPPPKTAKQQEEDALLAQIQTGLSEMSKDPPLDPNAFYDVPPVAVPFSYESSEGNALYQVPPNRGSQSASPDPDSVGGALYDVPPPQPSSAPPLPNEERTVLRRETVGSTSTEDSGAYQEVFSHPPRPSTGSTATVDVDNDTYLRPVEARVNDDTYLRPVEAILGPASPTENIYDAAESEAALSPASETGYEDESDRGHGSTYSRLKNRVLKGRGSKKETSGKSPKTAEPASVVDRQVEGLLNRRGPLHKWSTHMCELRKRGASYTFYCYKGQLKDGTVLHEVRLLGMLIGSAKEEVKRPNSFYIVKAPRSNQAVTLSKALFFQAHSEADYLRWLKSLQDVAQIKVQTVDDLAEIHTGGREVVPTMDLRQARKLILSDNEPDVGGAEGGEDRVSSEMGGHDNEELFHSRKGTGKQNSLPSPIQPNLPLWLQKDMEKSPNTTKQATSNKSKASQPLWWAQVRPASDAIVQGELNIRRHNKLAATWTTHWCTVRHQMLSCYRNMADAHPVLALQLNNQVLTNASERKRPFAFRIVINDRQAICFAADTKREMDRWMMVLIGQGKDAPPPVASRPSPYYILPDMVAEVPQPVIRQEGNSESSGSYYLDLQDEEPEQTAETVYYPPESLLPQVITAKMQASASPLPEPPSQPPPVPTGNHPVPVISPPDNNLTVLTAATPSYQGHLQKRNGPGMWHQQYCVIEGKKLAWYAQRGRAAPTQVQDLTNCTVAPSHKDSKRFTFKVVPPSPFPTLYFQAAREQECYDWMDQIKRAIQLASDNQDGALSHVPADVSPGPYSPRDTGRRKTGEKERKPERRPSLINRLRSWSQDNLNFGGRRRSAPASATAATNSSSRANVKQDTDRQSGFARGAISLGHGPFRRSRRNKKNIDEAPIPGSSNNPMLSGVLAIEDGEQGFVNHWCELKNLTFNIFNTKQQTKPVISALMPGYTVVASSADHTHDRIIQLTHLTASRPILIKVPASAQTFNSWLEALQTAAAQAKPPKRTFSFRLRRTRSVREPRGNLDTRGKQDPHSHRASQPLPPLPTGPGGNSPYQPGRGMGARPLPQVPTAGGSGGGDLLPTYASKLTTDLDALTKQAENDKQAAKEMAPVKTQQEANVLPTRVNASPAMKTVTVVHQGDSHTNKQTSSRTPTPPTAVKPPATAKKPTVPKRKESINTSDDAAVESSNLSKAVRGRNGSLPIEPRRMSSSPRPRTDSGTGKMAPPASLPAGCDKSEYERIVQRYDEIARSTQSASQVRRAALLSERLDITNQQEEVQKSLEECRGRLSSAKEKGKLFRGSTTGEMAEVQRQEAKLQNRAGYLGGKLSRLDDQLLRTSTELQANIDRLEKERDNEIQLLADDGLESSM